MPNYRELYHANQGLVAYPINVSGVTLILSDGVLYREHTHVYGLTEEGAV
jgi:hypothetical protein